MASVVPTSPYAATSRSGAADLATTIAAQQAQELATGAFVKTEAQLRQERRRRKKWTIFIATGCMLAFFIGLIAMIVEGSTYAYLAFVFPLFTGPWAIRQRRKLNKLPTLVYVINQIREEVNVMILQNNKLHVENNRLSKEITRLNEAETRLQAVAAKSGSNVKAICELVKENATTLRQMKVRLFLPLSYL
jgi:regulator of replication initiation timing